MKETKSFLLPQSYAWFRINTTFLWLFIVTTRGSYCIIKVFFSIKIYLISRLMIVRHGPATAVQCEWVAML